VAERPAGCALCRGAEADAELGCLPVWEDELWRCTATLRAGVAGYLFLEPRRHVNHVADLDGPEAVTFGLVLVRAARAVREAAGAERVHVHVYGGAIGHLHVHVEPFRGGAGHESEPAEDAEIRDTAERIRALLRREP
jgi:diadenosine tetraphosphate (Ap4A) HIT family hydrolase